MKDETKTSFQQTPAHPHLTRSVKAAEVNGKSALVANELPQTESAFNVGTTMGEIASDPMIREELKQTAAAMLIQRAFRAWRAALNDGESSETAGQNTEREAARFVKDSLWRFDQSTQEQLDFESATEALKTGTKWASNTESESTMVRTRSASMHDEYNKKKTVARRRGIPAQAHGART